MKRLGATFVAMLMTVMFSITSFAGTDFSDNWRYDQSSYTWYYYENGAPATNAWVHDHGYWYLLDDKGKMVTGIVKSEGRIYMMDVWEGTGHYGRMLTNGEHQMIDIVAEVSGPYEGALSAETVSEILSDSYLRMLYDSAPDVTGTRHIEAE